MPALKGKGDVIYPFSQGQMLGVIRYSRSGSDFRDQDIEAGVYTLRYAHQPVDGAHVGTSPTRDFLMLLNAEHDKVLKPASRDEMNEQSAEVAQSDLDIVSNGFKIRNSAAFENANGGTYIYFAFAETPFKYSRAR